MRDLVQRTAVKASASDAGSNTALPVTTSGKPLTAQMVEGLYELDDLRHLFAHNFAGRADAQYFNAQKRHVLDFGKVVRLSSGATFGGTYRETKSCAASQKLIFEASEPNL